MNTVNVLVNVCVVSMYFRKFYLHILFAQLISEHPSRIKSLSNRRKENHLFVVNVNISVQSITFFVDYNLNYYNPHTFLDKSRNVAFVNNDKHIQIGKERQYTCMHLTPSLLL